MLISKTCKSEAEGLRLKCCSAALRDQISVVGGYRKFMSSAQELAMISLPTCVFPGHPLGNLLLSPGPLPGCPESLGEAVAPAEGVTPKG